MNISSTQKNPSLQKLSLHSLNGGTETQNEDGAAQVPEDKYVGSQPVSFLATANAVLCGAVFGYTASQTSDFITSHTEGCVGAFAGSLTGAVTMPLLHAVNGYSDEHNLQIATMGGGFVAAPGALAGTFGTTGVIISILAYGLAAGAASIGMQRNPEPSLN